ncbi:MULTISPECIES: aminoglycoside phosphotransferase family protein [Paenibacillus]|uniref:aminoglycoside phosphotransferase family protein n=1 Tax=Paenibacillus TaxID=44249 RepID=UPI00203A9A9F|nr:aminoglycoside phosphotransferase family protein [Paenibacillus camelliae]MCM3633702.1 aminoglycoside phosphotransferase family protein [Paenibacillus camelliae]
MVDVQQHIKQIQSIPLFHDEPISIEPILKGYSNDMKYRVTYEQRPYLVKLFEERQFTAKQEEYDVLGSLRQLGVNCSEPIALGVNGLTGTGYLVLSYVEGEDASELLPHYSNSVQYRIGQQAGRQLRLIHRIKAPPTMTSWDERKLNKHKRYLERYQSLERSLKLSSDEQIISFIEEHLHLMQGRPNLLQHDDFHASNLIVKNEQLAGVIDFNRMDWGDPIHEFLKVGFFSVPVSIPFSIGQIRGYHGDQEPTEHFWKLYSLYTAMSVIASMVWITSVKPEESEQMLIRCEQVLEDHHHFASVVPKWYVDHTGWL